MNGGHKVISRYSLNLFTQSHLIFTFNFSSAAERIVKSHITFPPVAKDQCQLCLVNFCRRWINGGTFPDSAPTRESTGLYYVNQWFWDTHVFQVIQEKVRGYNSSHGCAVRSHSDVNLVLIFIGLDATDSVIL